MDSRLMRATCETCGARIDAWLFVPTGWILVLIHLNDGTGHEPSLLRSPEEKR